MKRLLPLWLSAISYSATEGRMIIYPKEDTHYEIRIC